MKRHKKVWTSQEDLHLIKLIQRNDSIDVAISELERTEQAIKTRANYLGFGYRLNKADEKTYFIDQIKHKNRRTNEEILSEGENIPIKPTISVEDCVQESTSIIANKSKADNESNMLQELNKLEVVFQEGIHVIKIIKEVL